MMTDNQSHIRYDNERVIVEGTNNSKDLQERIKAVKWPQECANCGGQVWKHDSFTKTETFGFANSVSAVVSGIPYCEACLVKVKNARKLNAWHWAIAILMSIPLIYLEFTGWDDSHYSLWLMCRGAGVIILLSYGLAWLIVKLPVKHFMKGKILDPVQGELFEEVRPGGDKVVSFALSISSKVFAAKFLDLNNQAPRENPSA